MSSVTKSHRSEPRNYLSMQKAVTLSGWLNARKGHADWAKTSRELLMELASKELGFPIGLCNLKTVAKASGIELPRFKIVKDRPIRIGEISNRNLSRQRINLLSRAVLELYVKLGEASPNYLNWDEQSEGDKQ